jgi:ATP-dependent DNA helicase RecG
MTTARVERALLEAPESIGDEVLALDEDQWFDRKSFRTKPEKLAEGLVGMANADGGTLVVGAWGGKIEGTQGSTPRRNGLAQANVDFCVPPVRARIRYLPCLNSKGKPDELLVIDVEPSDVVHATNTDAVFLRIGDENRRLSFHQRQELLYDKGQASYESRLVPGATLSDLDRPLLKNYANAVGHPEPERLLRARGLANDQDRLTIAGCLLFATEPQAFLPETQVRILRYRGIERGTGARQQLLDDVRLEGPIPRLLLTAQRTIKDLVPSRRALLRSGVFGEVQLVPEDAWLEGLVNAVVHRSYSLAGDHIRVEIFADRMEISSPGRFPGLVDLDDPLAAPRFARNPRIARVCADLNFGQELGEGIRRIFEEMRMAGLVDPIYRQTSASVVLTLSTELADRALEERLPRDSRKIIAALREADRLSTGEVSEVTGFSRPATIRRLNSLREAGLVKWIGKSPKDPRAYWTLIRSGSSEFGEDE